MPLETIASVIGSASLRGPLAYRLALGGPSAPAGCADAQVTLGNDEIDEAWRAQSRTAGRRPEPALGYVPMTNAGGGGRRQVALEGLLSGMVFQGLLLISGVLAARLLGPTDRGLLALIWVVTMILTQIGCLGIPIAVTYELAGGGVTVGTLAHVLRRILLIQLGGLTVALAVVLAVLTHVSGLPNGPALVSLAVLPAMVVQNYGLAAIQGSGSFRSLHVYRLMSSATYALSLIVGAIAGQDSLMFVTSAWVASFVFSAMLTAVAVLRLVKGEKTCTDPRTPSRAAMVRFGSSALLGYVSPTESFRVDQLVVGLALSIRDLGLYVAALAFCNLPRFLAQGLGLVAYPAIAGAPDLATKRRLLWKFVALGTGAAAVVVTPIIAFAHPLLNLAFGHEFVAAAATLQILLAGTVVLCARRLMADGLRGAGAPGVGSAAEALSWFWLVPALVVLVPSMGLEGVAIALSSSWVVTTCVLLGAAERRGLGVRPRRQGPVADPPS